MRAFIATPSTPRAATWRSSGRVHAPKQTSGVRPWSGRCRLRSPCRLLGQATYFIDQVKLIGLGLPVGNLKTAMEKLVSQRFDDEWALRDRIEDCLKSLGETPGDITTLLNNNIQSFLETFIEADSPKLNLISTKTVDAAVSIEVSSDSTGDPWTHAQLTSGSLSRWGDQMSLHAEKKAVIDPVRGRFALTSAPGTDVYVPTFYQGIMGPVGAGTYDRSRSVTKASVNTTALTTVIPNGQIGLGQEHDEPGPMPYTVNFPESGGRDHSRHP